MCSKKSKLVSRTGDLEEIKLLSNAGVNNKVKWRQQRVLWKKICCLKVMKLRKTRWCPMLISLYLWKRHNSIKNWCLWKKQDDVKSSSNNALWYELRKTGFRVAIIIASIFFACFFWFQVVWKRQVVVRGSCVWKKQTVF